jgi:TMAO reductase system protein TorT
MKRKTMFVGKILLATTLALSGAASSQAQIPNKKILIGAALPELQGSYWISIYYGLEDEARKQGVDLAIVNAGGFDQVTRQSQQIEDLMQRKVSALIVGATNATGIRQVVQEAAAKVPVFGLGSIPEPADKLTSIVVADHYGMGVLQAECLAKELGGKGTVGVMMGPPGVGWAMDRAKGFKDTMAKVAPNIKVIAEKATATGRTEGLRLMEDWLQAYPGMSGVYTAVDDLGAGAVDALVSGKKAGAIKISSSNLSPIGESYLRLGFLQCESLQQIVLQARQAVRQAVAHLKGEKIERILKSPVVLVTKNNVDTLDYAEIKAPRNYRPR